MGLAARRGRSPLRRPISTRSSSLVRRFPTSEPAARLLAWSSAQMAPTRPRPAACLRWASCSEPAPASLRYEVFDQRRGTQEQDDDEENPNEAHPPHHHSAHVIHHEKGLQYHSAGLGIGRFPVAAVAAVTRRSGQPLTIS